MSSRRPHYDTRGGSSSGPCPPPIRYHRLPHPKTKGKEKSKMHLTYSFPLLSSILLTALTTAEPFKCNPPSIQPINTVQVPFCCKTALLGALGLPSATGVGCTQYIISSSSNDYNEFGPPTEVAINYVYRQIRNRANLPGRPDSLLLLGGSKYFGLVTLHLASRGFFLLKGRQTG